ncbi:conserved hypothetical protein [Aggregatibacter segnis ATCC 33393]|uniref:Uncharacterized protein n=1 Tax=Aggregatibacter segnis ATCC 33393 TaxID=888057 RepID=E6KXH9_9PAST|nr:conserved hypothetical protein [Aggregatibacter segnis ATCC 33393]
MGKIRNVFIKQHQRGRWRYHWGIDFYTFTFVLVDKLYSSFIT